MSLRLRGIHLFLTAQLQIHCVGATERTGTERSSRHERLLHNTNLEVDLASRLSHFLLLLTNPSVDRLRGVSRSQEEGTQRCSYGRKVLLHELSSDEVSPVDAVSLHYECQPRTLSPFHMRPGARPVDARSGVHGPNGTQTTRSPYSTQGQSLSPISLIHFDVLR